MRVYFENLIDVHTGSVVEIEVPNDYMTLERDEQTLCINERASEFGRRCKAVMSERSATERK